MNNYKLILLQKVCLPIMIVGLLLVVVIGEVSITNSTEILLFERSIKGLERSMDVITFTTNNIRNDFEEIVSYRPDDYPLLNAMDSAKILHENIVSILDKPSDWTVLSQYIDSVYVVILGRLQKTIPIISDQEVFNIRVRMDYSSFRDLKLQKRKNKYQLQILKNISTIQRFFSYKFCIFKSRNKWCLF